MLDTNIDLDIFKYLYDKIEVSSQDSIKNNKYMCCGIAYNVIKNKDILLKYFLNNDKNSYQNLFNNLMNISSERKLNNPKINYYGEYLDEITIQEDFKEIYNNMNYTELIICEFYESDYLNNIYNIIESIKIGDPMIINRSKEVFTVIKLNENEFFVIDSHIRYHGKIKKNDLLNYMLINKFYKGILSIGVYK